MPLVHEMTLGDLFTNGKRDTRRQARRSHTPHNWDEKQKPNDCLTLLRRVACVRVRVCAVGLMRLGLALGHSPH